MRKCPYCQREPVRRVNSRELGQGRQSHDPRTLKKQVGKHPKHPVESPPMMELPCHGDEEQCPLGERFYDVQ
jgi:hypothetical protein